MSRTKRLKESAVPKEDDRCRYSHPERIVGADDDYSAGSPCKSHRVREMSFRPADSRDVFCKSRCIDYIVLQGSGRILIGSSESSSRNPDVA